MTDNIQYITDTDGKRLAVILSLEDYENLLAKLGMTADEYENSKAFQRLDDAANEIQTAGEIDV